MAISRWIQCEECITKYGFLAKHPTTGNAIPSPYGGRRAGVSLERIPLLPQDEQQKHLCRTVNVQRREG